jgi:hypothetical protein
MENFATIMASTGDPFHLVRGANEALDNRPEFSVATSRELE